MALVIKEKAPIVAKLKGKVKIDKTGFIKIDIRDKTKPPKKNVGIPSVTFSPSIICAAIKRAAALITIFRSKPFIKRSISMLADINVVCQPQFDLANIASGGV